MFLADPKSGDNNFKSERNKIIENNNWKEETQ